MAPGNCPLTLAQVEHATDQETLVVALGPDAARLDGSDSVAVEKALRQWLPDAVVMETASHDWVADPWAGQAWLMLRPQQLVESLAELQRPEGGVLLAGSDYANVWMGFIDGAIESGLTAARNAERILREHIDSTSS